MSMVSSLRSKPVIWPEFRGRMIANAGLDQLTWLKAGGPADWLFEPADLADLQHFLSVCPADMPITVLGAGSNVLVRDGGLDGVVIRLTGTLAAISHEKLVVTAGAGALDGDIARYAARAGLDGLDFLIGIPGTLGGGLRMNAGAYGSEFCDIVITATALNRRGELAEATPAQMQMGYRTSKAPADWIFVSARLQARPGDPAIIRARMKQIIASRGASQPVGARTGGSTFANPQGGKAWQLIEEAGCRGLQLGDAMMSEKHCNFMINQGRATASDLEQLGETVRQRVLDQTGTALRWEIRRMGRPPASSKPASNLSASNLPGKGDSQ